MTPQDLLHSADVDVEKMAQMLREIADDLEERRSPLNGADASVSVEAEDFVELEVTTRIVPSRKTYEAYIQLVESYDGARGDYEEDVSEHVAERK